MSTRLCPFCGSPVGAADTFCTECGSVLEGSSSKDEDMTRFVYDDDEVEPADGSLDGDTPTKPPVVGRHTNTVLVGEDPGRVRTDQRYHETPAPAPHGNGALVALIAALLVGALGLGAFFVLSKPGDDTTQTCTVSFETNGGTQMDPLEVEREERVFTPTDPTRSGYDFEGWFTTSDFSEAAVFPFEAEGDVILYAKWEKQEAETASDEGADDATDASEEPAETEAEETPAPPQTGQTEGQPGQQALGFMGITGAQASSVHAIGGDDRGPYGAECVLDGDPTTAWVEGTSGNGEGESITLTGPQQTISGFDIRSGYHKYSKIGVDLYTWNARPQNITVYAHNTAICTQTLADAGHQFQRVSFPQPVETDSITIVINSVYTGNESDCAISEISCF